MAEAPQARPGEDGRHDGRLARSSARMLVRGRWLVIGFWIAAVLGSVFVLPTLDTSGGGDLDGLIPDDAPAIATELRDVEIFGFPLTGRTAVVQRDPDGITVYDQARTAVAAAAVTRKRYPRLDRVEGALPLSNGLGVFPETGERGTTSITYLLFRPDVSFGQQTRQARRYAEIFFGPRDSVVGISGSVPARGAQGDVIREGLPRAELFTLLAIMLIVGVALRSVVAPVVAVISAGVAYVMTLRLSGAFTALVGVSSPSELEPVVVALLLGVVTDYVVFYLAAMRTDLLGGQRPRDAAESSARRFGPIVLVAGLAVAAGTGALLAAESVFFRALGPALVFTVVIGLVVAVTLVPALMAVLGRWCFWPGRAGRVREESYEETRALLTTVDPREPWLTRMLSWLTASRRRAGSVVAGCVAVLALAAVPVAGLGLGVSFVGSLPPDSGVLRAAEQARTGFAPGILSPTTLLIEGEELDRQTGALGRLGALLEARPGVAGVLGPSDVPGRVAREVLVRPDGSAARMLIVLSDPALGASGVETVDALQADLPGLVATAGLETTRVGVAGDSPTAAYIVQQTTDDLLRIAIAALGANLLMLVVFLRAVVAALYLLVGSMLTLGSALGLTILVFEQVDPGAGLTFYVPFAAAVLLLAFGSDYNIYAVGSVWEHARRRPLRESILTVMPGSISAIFVAGVALAASFGLLSVVELVPFRQLAFMMAVGIMIDVVVVRSLLLPAMLTLVGTASAWPSSALVPDRPAPGEER